MRSDLDPVRTLIHSCSDKNVESLARGQGGGGGVQVRGKFEEMNGFNAEEGHHQLEFLRSRLRQAGFYEVPQIDFS